MNAPIWNAIRRYLLTKDQLAAKDLHMDPWKRSGLSHPSHVMTQLNGRKTDTSWSIPRSSR